MCGFRRKSTKPIKPKSTIQFVSDSSEKEVLPIYIIAAAHRSAETLCIYYGNSAQQVFERIEISTCKKLRGWPLFRGSFKKKSVSKDDQDVHYSSSQASSVPTKMESDGQQEMPMEKRLESLMLNDTHGESQVPKANNVAQLLIQGLHSRDTNILRTVLFNKDEEVIKKTIKRIPATLIVTLFEELSRLMQDKASSRQIALMWLKHLITIHYDLLLNSELPPSLLDGVLGSIEAGLALQAPRNRLMGRLSLLGSQIEQAQSPQSEEPPMVFDDEGSNSSEDEKMEFEENSNSGNEWSSEEAM